MDENGRKYLDFLQSVITRLASNSFQLKNWSVGLASVIIGLTAKDAQPRLAWLALIPIAAFWMLDAYYLGLERKFRSKYEAALISLRNAPDGVAGGANTPRVYDMNVGELSCAEWGQAAGKLAVMICHAPLAAIAVLVALWGFFFKAAMP